MTIYCSNDAVGYSARLLSWINHIREAVSGEYALRIAVMGPQRRFATEELIDHPQIEIIDGENYLWPLSAVGLKDHHFPIASISTQSPKIAKRFFELVGDSQKKTYRIAVWVGGTMQKPVFPDNADETWQFDLKPSLTDYVRLTARHAFPRRRIFTPCSKPGGSRFTPGLLLDPVNERQIACIERLARILEKYGDPLEVEEPECRSDATNLVRELTGRVNRVKTGPLTDKLPETVKQSKD